MLPATRVLPFPASLQPAEQGCARCSARPDDVLALTAQLIDAELHDVAPLQPHRRREPHPDAGRRSGVDEIPGLHDEKLAQAVHDEVRVEDHARGRAGLPPDAVDIEPHAQGQDVADLVGGDQPRASRVEGLGRLALAPLPAPLDRKSTRLNSSHMSISYAVFCLKKKKNQYECRHDYIKKKKII